MNMIAPPTVEDAAEVDSGTYLRRIFQKYGDGETMTLDGFERMLGKLDLLRVVAERAEKVGNDKTDIVDLRTANSTPEERDMCISKDSLTQIVSRKSSEDNSINQSALQEVCPAILFSMLAGGCIQTSEEDIHIHDISPVTANSLVWIYSILAVVLISICGVLSLVVIPIMQKNFYKPLIQFLVALAVGTLAGDALLHLLPHAMTSSHSHETDIGHMGGHDSSHDENTWKGFVAMLGLTFFFIMEKIISLMAKWRKNKQKNKHTHVKVLDDENGLNKNDTHCMDKYNPSPYCYKDIMNGPDTMMESDKTATTMLELSSNSDIQSLKKSRSPTIQMDGNQTMADYAEDLLNMEGNKMLSHPDHDDYTVIVREHKSDHHGHSHKHGHVHAAPQNFSSVAWMVIMGDGLHNFTDGMAIGAAFSGGLAGGFSTTVAVFCHELPHELGDFAMLLKAGMSIKQAMFYNMLSSVLCIFGNVFGLWLGNTEYASTWVFAAAAGMFIYIALVDMIPELSNAHEDEDNIYQCILHLSGLLMGFGIMTLIAVYEHDLKHIFNDTA